MKRLLKEVERVTSVTFYEPKVSIRGISEDEIKTNLNNPERFSQSKITLQDVA
jgi:hypothetical protein